MLDRRDWECVKAHGIDPEAVEAQLVGFREGFPYLDVVRPASWATVFSVSMTAGWPLWGVVTTGPAAYAAW